MSRSEMKLMAAEIHGKEVYYVLRDQVPRRHRWPLMAAGLTICIFLEKVGQCVYLLDSLISWYEKEVEDGYEDEDMVWMLYDLRSVKKKIDQGKINKLEE